MSSLPSATKSVSESDPESGGESTGESIRESEKDSERTDATLDPQAALAAFKSLFAELDKSNLHRIEDVFTDDIVFIDPFHEVRGLDNLKAYYASMYENLNSITFVFDEDIVQDNRAVITWTMIYSHPKLKGGKELRMEGVSRLEFVGDKVAVHRDYFDAGALLYEHIPVIGWAVQKIKRQL